MEKVLNPIDQRAKSVFISKLNGSHKEMRTVGHDQYMGLNFTLPAIAKNTKVKKAMNKIMTELHPDIQLCSDILTSSILASNDMMTYNLIYGIEDSRFPMDFTASAVKTIEDHTEANYKLTSKLKEITEESLVELGAWIEVVIPEAALDEIINAKYDTQGKEISQEAYNKNLNRLNQSTGILNSNKDLVLSCESIDKQKLTYSYEAKDDLITITDDLSVLTTTLIAKEQATSKGTPGLNKYFGKAGNISLENIDMLNNISDRFRDNDADGRIELIKVKSSKSTRRKSIGKPLTMKVPIESIIPITLGGDTSNHIYYILLLNENGTPLEITEDEYRSLNNSNVITNLGNTNTVSGDAVNSVLNKAISSMSISGGTVNSDELEKVYGNILNEIVSNKLDKNTFTQNDELIMNASFYKVMLNRALKAKKTKMLFLPKELVQYYAFEYDSNGIGVSKLEKLQMLFSLKSILLLSRVNSTIKNSIPITKVTGSLEEFDTQPIKTMEKIKSQVISSRQNLVPLGMIDAKDISSWLHQSGIVMQLSHPAVPNMELNVSDENRNLVTPDGELETKIDEKIYMGMSLTPEIVQAGYQTDYATTVTAKNLLMAKRISEFQETLTAHLSNHLRIYLSCDMGLQEKLERLAEKNIEDIKKRYLEILENEDLDEDEKAKYTLLVNNEEVLKGYILNSIIKKANIKLPTIDMVEAPALKNALNDYKEALDNYIELLLPDSVLAAGLGDEMSGKVTVIRDIIKSTLIRKFMNDNNYIPELTDMITTDSDGKPKINLLGEFNTLMKPLGEALLNYYKDEEGVKKILTDAYNAAGIGGSTDEGSGYGDDNSGSGENEGENSGSDGDNFDSGSGSDDYNDTGDGGDSGFDMGDSSSGDNDTGGSNNDGSSENTETGLGEDNDKLHTVDNGNNIGSATDDKVSDMDSADGDISGSTGNGDSKEDDETQVEKGDALNTEDDEDEDLPVEKVEEKPAKEEDFDNKAIPDGGKENGEVIEEDDKDLSPEDKASKKDEAKSEAADDMEAKEDEDKKEEDEKDQDEDKNASTNSKDSKDTKNNRFKKNHNLS